MAGYRDINRNLLCIIISVPAKSFIQTDFTGSDEYQADEHYSVFDCMGGSQETIASPYMEAGGHDHSDCQQYTCGSKEQP